MGLLSYFQTNVHKAWTQLVQMDQLAELEIKSNTKPQIIFKHSTTCSISRMALGRMEEGLNDLLKLADIYYLDLLAYRKISNAVAEKWKVQHESPQVLMIKNGICIYSSSHQMVQPMDLISHLQ